MLNSRIFLCLLLRFNGADCCSTFYEARVNITGVGAAEAVGSWYRKKGVGSKHMWQDTCGEGLAGIPCNKGCPLPVSL